MASTSLSEFVVRRCAPELIRPAQPTPYEVKPLSDIDDQDGIRFEMPVIYFYRSCPSMHGRDPVKVIREALSRVLVFYYPLAGRVREGVVEGRKLVVECNGEGVMFVEAEANVSFEQFGDELPPPSPWVDELIFEVEGSGGIVNCPLFLIQVTRLTCGGFVLAIRLNHVMSDAGGLVLFTNALAEMARGLPVPTTPPVWSRHLVNARTPPRITHPHPEYEQVPLGPNNLSLEDTEMIHRSLFFGPTQMSALRNRVPPHLRTCSSFELLTACLWRSRTIALGLPPTNQVRIICIVNVRTKYKPPLPAGYYGNAFAFAVAISSAGKLCTNPLGYALNLVVKAKAKVTDEYMRSVADLMVLKGRPHFTTTGAYLVSDVTRARLDEVDFGWGNAVYGGPAKGGVGAVPGFSSFFIKYKNQKGEVGTVVPVCLPARAMAKFEEEVGRLIRKDAEIAVGDNLVSRL